LTVPAGFTLSELANRVSGLPGRDAQSFLAAGASGAVHSPWQPPGSTNLEGLLGTGLYQVPNSQSDTQLLSAMVQRFDKQAAAAGATPAIARSLGVTPYQLVIVASIVEKEAVYPKNMARVAAVIYNRLRAGMPLQMDSTVLYALGQDGGPVTPQDLEIDSPYNTYRHTGLPPTPTSFPSVAALHAAAHPAQGDWLYFVVVDQNGTEAFSPTYAGQLRNEALARSRGVG
jgi:UPF0755 protein